MWARAATDAGRDEVSGFPALLYPLVWEGGGGNVGQRKEQVCTALALLCTAHCCTLVPPGMGGWRGKSWGRDRCALHTAHCCIISTVGQKPTVVPPGTGRGRENVGGGIGVHCAQPTVA